MPDESLCDHDCIHQETAKSCSRYSSTVIPISISTPTSFPSPGLISSTLPSSCWTCVKFISHLTAVVSENISQHMPEPKWNPYRKTRHQAPCISGQELDHKNSAGMHCHWCSAGDETMGSHRLGLRHQRYWRKSWRYHMHQIPATKYHTPWTPDMKYHVHQIPETRCT
jgi:hypothetical protein